MVGEVGNLSDSASEERARSRARCASSLLCRPSGGAPPETRIGGVSRQRRCPPAEVFRHSIALVLSVGPSGGAWGSVKLAGPVPYRGEPAARGEVAEGHHHEELSPDLFEQGNCGPGVQADDQASCPSSLVGKVDEGRGTYQLPAVLAQRGK